MFHLLLFLIKYESPLVKTKQIDNEMREFSQACCASQFWVLKCVFIFCKCFRTACTVPLIDYIDGNDYSIEPQQGGDEDGFARGAWDWSLLWKRIPLSHKEKAKRKHKTEPYR